MSKKVERNLNITLKNDDGADKEELIISFSAFMKQLKRFFIFWLVAAIIAAILIPVYFAVFTADQHKNMRALISFNYDGVEQGLAPDGSKFDINMLKSPTVIEQTLTDMGLPLTMLEPIRQGISFEGVVPANAIDRIAVYKSAYDSGNIQAAKEILDTTYFPTQYTVTFNYSAAGLSSDKAVEVFNGILNNYGEYFFKTYGFNEALGSAVTTLDYKTYDYPEQIDVFTESLRSMQNYISTLSASDTTRFRSTVTGYTFADLSQAIGTINDVDLAVLSAKILNNNVTKDKNYLLDYYERRIEVLSQEAAVAEGQVKTLTEAIANYQVGSVVVYADGSEKSYNSPSESYDKLFEQLTNQQRTMTTKQEQLKDMQTRLNRLKLQPAASPETIADVDAQMAALSTKVNDLLNKTNATANEYYETVYLANSYKVLVPASSSGLTLSTSIIKASVEPMVIVEALLFVVYFGFAFCYSLFIVNRAKRQEKHAAEAAAPEDEEDDEDDEDASEAETEKSASKKNKKA